MTILSEKKSKVKVGDEFGNWTLIGVPFYIRNKWMRQAWGVCQCKCGSIHARALSELRANKTKSCGCKEFHGLKTHGDAGNGRKTRLYRIWRGMKTRCTNKNTGYFERYGGRGIAVCDE